MGATAPLGRERTKTVAITRPKRAKPTYVRAGRPKPAQKPKRTAKPRVTASAGAAARVGGQVERRPARASETRERAQRASHRSTAAHRIRATKHRVRTAAAAATVAARPHLRLVARPRFAVNAALVLAAVVVALMLATVVLHTRLAERQVEIDRLEASVTEARERFDVLRRQRAELRAPTRLASAAGELGMAEASRTDFLAIDPSTVAEVLASAGPILGDDVHGGDDDVGLIEEPLDQIRRVKTAAGTTP